MEAYGALVWIITLTPTGLLEMRLFCAARRPLRTRREKIVLLGSNRRSPRSTDGHVIEAHSPTEPNINATVKRKSQYAIGNTFEHF